MIAKSTLFTKTSMYDQTALVSCDNYHRFTEQVTACCSHSGVCGLVDNDTLARLINVVVQPKEGRDSMHQHTVIR